MNAVEKVARVVHDSIYDSSCECNPLEPGSPGMEAAAALLAAFPQLALEGREEWSHKFPAGMALVTQNIATHTRTVWESPWSEVQS